jgi:hypothetical protein
MVGLRCNRRRQSYPARRKQREFEQKATKETKTELEIGSSRSILGILSSKAYPVRRKRREFEQKATKETKTELEIGSSRSILGILSRKVYPDRKNEENLNRRPQRKQRRTWNWVF